jgi:hypothetical protein
MSQRIAWWPSYAFNNNYSIFVKRSFVIFVKIGRLGGLAATADGLYNPLICRFGMFLWTKQPNRNFRALDDQNCAGFAQLQTWIVPVFSSFLNAFLSSDAAATLWCS